jgi:hypothetical protein
MVKAWAERDTQINMLLFVGRMGIKRKLKIVDSE